MDIVKQWWTRNWSGLLAACIIAVFFYAMTAWVRNTVTDQLKNYVPTAIWLQWSTERAEWRGKVEAELSSLKKENMQQRDDILIKLQELKTDVRVLTALLQEHKKETLNEKTD